MKAPQQVLAELRAKPEPVRRRLTLVISITITALIVLVWFVSLRASLLSLDASVPSQENPLSLLEHMRRIGMGVQVVIGWVAQWLP